MRDHLLRRQHAEPDQAPGGFGGRAELRRRFLQRAPVARWVGGGDRMLAARIRHVVRFPGQSFARAQAVAIEERRDLLVGATARELADDLTRTVLEPGLFDEVVERLRAAKTVNTPTLAVVANRFLGNSKPYTGRKGAIDDIVRRQKADAREHARSRALSRLGV